MNNIILVMSQKLLICYISLYVPPRIYELLRYPSPDTYAHDVVGFVSNIMFAHVMKDHRTGSWRIQKSLLLAAALGLILVSRFTPRGFVRFEFVLFAFENGV